MRPTHQNGPTARAERRRGPGLRGTAAGNGAGRAAHGAGGRATLAHHLVAVGMLRAGGRPDLLEPPQSNIDEPRVKRPLE